MPKKAQVLYYDVPLSNNLPTGLSQYTDILYDKHNQRVGLLGINKLVTNDKQQLVLAVITTDKGTINYNYVRQGTEPIIAKSVYSKGYCHAIIKRKYVSETRRKLTIIYDD